MAEGTLEDGAQAVGSRDPRRLGVHSPRGELAPWSQFCSYTSSHLHCQTCVSKPDLPGLGFQRQFYFFSCPDFPLPFGPHALPIDNAGFPRGLGCSCRAAGAVSGSHSLIWQPISALGSQHLSGEGGWDNQLTAPDAHGRGLSAWLPLGLAEPHQIGVLRHPWG